MLPRRVRVIGQAWKGKIGSPWAQGFIQKQKKINLRKGGSINEREYEEISSIYLNHLNMLFSICSYQPWQFSQNRRPCTLISKTQSHVHCSHQWEILRGLEEVVPAESKTTIPARPPSWDCQLPLQWVTLAWGGHRGASVDLLLLSPTQFRKHQCSTLRSYRSQMEYIQNISQVI